jgi:hypothetical protein
VKTAGGVATLRAVGVLNSKVDVTCLVDSGASQNFLSLELLKEAGVPMGTIEGDPTVRLGDGRIVSALGLAKDVPLKLGAAVDRMEFVVLPNSCGDVVLGMPWLTDKNPRIDWRKRTVVVDGQVISVGPSMEANSMFLGLMRLNREEKMSTTQEDGKDHAFIEDEETLDQLGVVAVDGSPGIGKLVVARKKSGFKKRWFGPMWVHAMNGSDKFQLKTLQGHDHPQMIHIKRLLCVQPASVMGGIESSCAG